MISIPLPCPSYPITPFFSERAPVFVSVTHSTSIRNQTDQKIVIILVVFKSILYLHPIDKKTILTTMIFHRVHNRIYASIGIEINQCNRSRNFETNPIENELKLIFYYRQVSLEIFHCLSHSLIFIDSRYYCDGKVRIMIKELHLNDAKYNQFV